MMKHKLLSVWLVAALMASVLALTGCATGAPSLDAMDDPTRDPVPASAIEQGDVIQVVVENPEGGLPLADAYVKYEDAMTALSALTELDIMVAVTESSFGSFVQVIDSISNEGSAGWTYTVNGQRPSVSSGNYVLEAGDKVVWRYSTE